MRQIVLFLTLLFGNSMLLAQEDVVRKTYTIDKSVPSYVDLPEVDVYAAQSVNSIESEGKAFLAEMLGLNDRTSVLLVDTISDVAGGFHKSYEEYYDGILVYGTRYTIHYNKEGRIVSLNGNFRSVDGYDCKMDCPGLVGNNESFVCDIRNIPYCAKVIVAPSLQIQSFNAMNKYGYGPVYQKQIELYGTGHLSLEKDETSRSVIVHGAESSGMLKYNVANAETGRMVQAGEVYSDRGRIDLSTEGTGMYIVTLTTNKGNSESFKVSF